MAAAGRVLRAALRSRAEALNRLLNLTVTQSRLVQAAAPPSADGSLRMQLAFRQGGHVAAAPLQTRFGRMALSVGQVYEARPGEDGAPGLTLVLYRYALYRDAAQEPILRWEYDRQPRDPDAKWCRHHLQGPVRLPIGGVSGVSFNDLHLPTGHIDLDVVLRFCIVDLGVQPLSERWDELLTESPSHANPRFGY